MPLPHIAIEGHLAVDLELVHVEVFAKDLAHRFDHPRVARQAGVLVVVHVGGEVGAHHVARLLAHILGSPLGIDARHFGRQAGDFFRREQAWKKQVTVTVELGDLLRCQLHGCLL